MQNVLKAVKFFNSLWEGRDFLYWKNSFGIQIKKNKGNGCRISGINGGLLVKSVFCGKWGWNRLRGIWKFTNSYILEY